MRSLSSGLMSAIVIGIALAGSIGVADARGRGGAGFAVGGRAGGGLVRHGAGFGGRDASLGRRFGSGDRFGYGRGRFGDGYGLGYPGFGYGGYGDGYGAPYGGSFGSAYDPGRPTSIGIPPSPVAPPAIYVLGGSGRVKASGVAVRGWRASRTLTAQSSDAVGDSGVVTGGPRVIRVAR